MPFSSFQPSRENHNSAMVRNSSAGSIMRLQETIDNQAAQIRSNSRFDFGKVGIQTKLRISQTKDIHEQEANRVAEQVMRMPFFSPADSPIHLLAKSTNEELDRKCSSCEMKTNGKKEDEDEDKVMNISRRPFSNATHLQTTDEIANEINGIRDRTGLLLDKSTKEFMETRFGYDFSNVRTHTGELAARSANSVNALAYTIGNDIVFGEQQYAPHTYEGRKLLAHELTHVVQQEGNVVADLMRMPKDNCPEPSKPEPDYGVLAKQINEGIEYFWGTDEEKIYRALRALDRDEGRICRLEQVYREDYDTSLLEDIYSDFSGEELEYAMQLLNKGARGSKQRVQAAPITYSGLVADAQRLHDAAKGLGTDEEAIFAVLTPLSGKPEMKELKETYEKEYRHTIREMIEEEMSGSEQDFALELLDMPEERESKKREKPSLEESTKEVPLIGQWIAEAFEKLSKKGVELQVWWDRRRDGTARWDDRYWVFDGEEKYLNGTMKREDAKLSLKHGILPHVAVDALFDEQYQWGMDCGQFVQVARLYVQRKLLPSEDGKEFDEWTGGHLELSTHAPEEFRHALFLRAHKGGIPEDAWVTKPTGRLDVIPEERMLDMAPVGSRMRFTSSWTKEAAEVGQRLIGRIVTTYTWFAFQNENAVKIGSDRYAAHGLGLLGYQEIVENMIDSTRAALGAIAPRAIAEGIELPASLSDAEIKSRIFVDNIEYYRWKE